MGFTSSNKLALMVVCDFFFLSVVLDKGTLDALYTDTSDKVVVVTTNKIFGFWSKNY